MQEFYILKDSTNPVLRMELIDDGRFTYKQSMFNKVLQDSEVTFSMRDVETGILKVAKSTADIVLAENTGCEEKYILQYKWKERDVRKEGEYEGWFDIKFNGNLSEEGIEYPNGNLRVPIENDLRIIIK